MAELKFEAPLANFEGEEWNDFNEFQGAGKASPVKSDKSDDRNENSLMDNFNETISTSLEDLVNTFDEKLTKCFKNHQVKAETNSNQSIKTQEEIINDCQMWWTITGNYGNVLPIDWSKSYARQLHTEALHLEDKKDEEELNLDLSDDEELQAAFDMHSLIVSSLHHEPLFSADDVINEIEGIMKEADEFEEETALNNRSSTSIELLQLKYKTDITPSNIEGTLKSLSTVALNELYEELEGTVKELSETLIQQLALRDELEYEKELKNQFISLLLSLQKKRRELPAASSGIKVPGSKKIISPDGFGKYLTMSIPYNSERVGPPTNEELQIFIKIMKAMNEDSPVVPTLLTDYILKGLILSSKN